MNMLNKRAASAPLSRLPAPATDPVFGVMMQCRRDHRPDKIDLTAGVYCTPEGPGPVMRAVREAETRLALGETTKTYRGLAGDEEFNQRLTREILGDAHLDARCQTVQTVGGSGALRGIAELINLATPGGRLWLPNQSWNYHPILLAPAGLALERYPYYDDSRHGIDFDRSKFY